MTLALVRKSLSLGSIRLNFWLPLTIFFVRVPIVEDVCFVGFGVVAGIVIGKTKFIPSILSLIPSINFIALFSLR